MTYLATLTAEDQLWIALLLCFPIVCLTCAVALGIAWGGRRVGMLVGILGLTIGLYGLAVLLLGAPQVWWISVIPLGIGAATLRAWYYHSGPVAARRLRFNLRELSAVILFIALILGGITSQYRQMRIEEAVATKIETLPGVSGSNFVEWRLGRVNGARFLVPLDPANFDEVADALERLSQLQVLQINDLNLPARITRRLGRLATLRTLNMQHAPVADDDLRPLANLQNLEYLELNADHLTDAGLVHLRSLRRLRVLNLYDARQITPAAMTNLRRDLPRLDNP
jgi:hypothetical protein